MKVFCWNYLKGCLWPVSVASIIYDSDTNTERVEIALNVMT